MDKRHRIKLGSRRSIETCSLIKISMTKYKEYFEIMFKEKRRSVEEVFIREMKNDKTTDPKYICGMQKPESYPRKMEEVLCNSKSNGIRM